MSVYVFFFQAEDGIRDLTVTGVQTCALPISHPGRLRCLDEAGCSGGFAMTTVAATAHTAHAHHDDRSFIRKYIFSTDHKIIGIQFLFVSLFFLLVGGLLADRKSVV